MATAQAATAKRTILRAEGLWKRYPIGEGTLDVLKGIDVSVHEGEILAILGPSGAGKSTLLHLLGLLDTPSLGTVYLDGQDMFKLSDAQRARTRNQVIGFVFQFYHLLPDLSALENVCLPTMIQKSWFSYQRRETEERAKSLLDRVGLSSRMKHRSGQLSGGERQRVAIARALMNTPQLLLCDEPTGNLDQKTAEGVLELIWSLASETKTTFVIVTHAKELGKRADRFIEVIDGKIVATG